ncbi:iron-sulfur cluster assembly scaffold protein [Mesorhizobium sp. WSM2239]|uniref:Nitrogen fixation protein NifU n=2 Tax=unclassified Mesorhizobium TaxID=325217 RepID=A0AAU8D797_9HYPH
MWGCGDKADECFLNPKSVSVLERANTAGEDGAIAWEYPLKFMMSIDPVTERITDAKFQTFGRGSAIASSSALTGLVLGKSADRAFPIINHSIADSLGCLPPKRTHCGVMSYETLQPAIANHYSEQWGGDHEQRALARECFGVDQGMIERAVVWTGTPLSSRSRATQGPAAGGSHASKQSSKCLCECDGRRMPHHGSGGLYRRHNRRPRPQEQAKVESRFWSRRSLAAGCGDRRHPKQFNCQRHPKLPAAKLRRCNGGSPAVSARLPHATAPVQTRPSENPVAGSYLRADGGDCELVDEEDDQVYVKLSGACAGSSSLRHHQRHAPEASMSRPASRLASFRSTEDRTHEAYQSGQQRNDKSRSRGRSSNVAVLYGSIRQPFVAAWSWDLRR